MNRKFLIYLLAVLSHRCESKNSDKAVLTPKIYSSMLIRRREEHKLFVKHLQKANYEKTYKMLDMAFDKLIELIAQHNATLYENFYNVTEGFPKEERVQDAVSLIVENICLAGEIILHFPELSQRILKKFTKWKEIFNWGIRFVLNFKDEIIDENTVKMLNLFKQEINEDQRDNDYVNPYYKISNEVTKTKPPKKKKKSIKKGPQLYSKNEL